MKSLLARNALVVFALCLATYATIALPWRFEPAGESLTIEPPGHVPKSWIVGGAGVRPATAAEGGGLILPAPGRSISFVSTVLGRSTPFSHLSLRAELRTEGLRPGRDGWQRVQAIIISFDRSMRPIGYWPKKLITLDEDLDWQTFAATFPLHPETGALRLLIYNAAERGLLQVRRIELAPLAERGGFAVLRYLLVGLWALALLFAARAVLRAEGRRAAKAVLVLMFAGATLAIVTPQPYYGQIVHTLGGLARALTAPAPAPAVPAAVPQAEPSATPEPADRAEAPEAPEAPEVESRKTEAPAILPHLAPRESLFERLHFKQVAHYTMFLLLTLVSLTVFPRRPALFVLACLALYAVSTEFLQLFLATRSSSIGDLGIDALGMATGALLYAGLRLAPGLAAATARSAPGGGPR